MKINLVGESFAWTGNGNYGYSVWGKESVFIQWVRDDPSVPVVMYVDGAIDIGLTQESPGRKYGWILESDAIDATLNRVWASLPAYADAYDRIFTYDPRMARAHPKFAWCPAGGTWIAEPAIHNKTRLASMICSGKDTTVGQKLRLEWRDRLTGKLDIYGATNYIERKEQGLNDYMFSVAIENTSRPGYYTEKLLDCFATGTVPVYWGAPDIGDYFDARGIVALNDNFDVDILTPELYHRKMEAIRTNYTRVQEYPTLEDYIFMTHLKGSL